MASFPFPVPPSKPLAQVPSSVTIGNRAVLTCVETDGSPPPTFKWFKNDMVMPEDPKTNTLFKNSSYTLDPKSGVLIFEPATSFYAGEVNVGGIVAAVVVLLIVFGLAAFGIWFAYSRGYFSIHACTPAILQYWGRGNARPVGNVAEMGERKKNDFCPAVFPGGSGSRSGSKKVIYSQPSTRSDGEFKQTSSFLV
uniref:Uncharacterized protein n=1 Tax=Sphaerodactylus townsendi TaxID=933632 RepID=A0ACB8G9Q6_9SAUR